MVINSGATLKWSVSGGGVSIPEITIDDPTLDLSGNTGTTTITITSDEGFSGLNTLDLWVAPIGGLITDIDLSNALALTSLNVRYNALVGLDVAQNTALTSLIIRGRDQIPDQALVTTTNTQLTELWSDDTGINSVDLSTNTLLTDVRLYESRLTSTVLDQIVIDLDNHGLSNGNLEIRDQTTGDGLTFVSLVAYNNLIAKGWTIDVPAPPAAPGPEINLVGNGVSIPSGNSPIIADDTDFGQVAIGSPVTKTFTIENLGDSDLTITGAFGVVPPPYSISVLPSSPVASGNSTTLEITYTPITIGANQNVQVVIIHNDFTGAESPFLLNLTGEGVAASSGTIAVSGNSIPISNGDTSPDLADGTDFGQETLGITKTNTFTIANNSLTETLTIDNISLLFGGSTSFVLSGVPASYPVAILPGNNLTFNVDFTPTSAGTFNGSIQIDNSETSEDPFQFSITGEGITAAISNDIMITQYYEGISNSKWVEIKNISGGTIPANTYYLALYNDSDLPNITTLAPTANESIPEMANGEVLLFRNAAATVPSAANLGSATQIITSVCNFDGDDVVLISTTNDTTSYANRQDIIGDIDVSSWGPDRSYIRGGCSSEAPALDYDENDWIELSVSTDVSVANTNTNIALGTQAIGTTIWNGATWTNLQPDKTRSVQLSGNYSSADGSFDACNLIIDTGAFLNLDGGTTNTVSVEKNLTINGSFTVGDTESLVTNDPSAASITGVITKKESSTSRSNEHDVTYWSSPINNGNIGTAFAGVTPSRIWYITKL